MLVVIALGGKTLLGGEQPLDASVPKANVKLAAQSVAEVARDHRVVLTHGNGPQVGLLALQDGAGSDVAGSPLDILDAESEGMVDHLLEQELGRHLPQGRLATLLTQVIVDPGDPAFSHPTTFVGVPYEARDARFLAHERSWVVAPDGEQWRRVVPSPEPQRIVEIDTIRVLVDHGITVTCVGGGGIPVVRDGRGGLRGVEAVIDEDLSASLLASSLGADALLLLTDVDAVHTDWGTPDQRPIHETTPAALRSLDVPAGSMGPKVDAACRFVENGGTVGAIGALPDAANILRGGFGTTVRSPHS
jgi:carbamate kinase